MQTPVEISPKILLAEDDNDMRRFLVKALQIPAMTLPRSTTDCRLIIACGRNRSNCC